MFDYGKLREEEAWGAQFESTALAVLRKNLEEFYKDTKGSIHTIGDSRHLSGYHRSRRWIKTSAFCTNRTLSVTESDGNIIGGNDNWVSAIDLVIGKARVFSVVHAVTMAMSHGAIPYVRTVSVESSPWTACITLDRGSHGEGFDELYRVITGTFAVHEDLMDVPLKLPALALGSHGGYVTTAQHLLWARGFPVDLGGSFGDEMHDQTVRMQKRHGAKLQTGVWTPETWLIAITGVDTI